MLYIFGKTVLGHLCFKYLKMIISSNYALKPVFPILKIYRIKGCGKNEHILKFKLRGLY